MMSMLDSQTWRLIEGGIQKRDIAKRANFLPYGKTPKSSPPVGDLIRTVGPVSNCVVMSHDEYARFTNLEADRRRNTKTRHREASEFPSLRENAQKQPASWRPHPNRRPSLELRRDGT